MDTVEILKATSNAFNASDNHSQFRMRLDLAGVDEREALEAYRSLPWFDWLTEYMCGDRTDWHDFTFRLALSKDNLEKFAGRWAQPEWTPRKPGLPWMFEPTPSRNGVEICATIRGKDVSYITEFEPNPDGVYQEISRDVQHELFLENLYYIELETQEN